MSNVLFINLKRNGDIFNTAALAQSYLREHPHATPYILTYDEFKKATKPLSVFKGVFTLDRKKITTFHNHNLYSNGFALSELFEELDVIESISWSEIVNYSSDKASTFLSNYLSQSSGAKISGIHYGLSNNIDYKSGWEILFNEIMTLEGPSPVHFSTAYHGMCDIQDCNGQYKVKKIQKHEETITNNFGALKKNNSAVDTTCSIVGIQLFSSLNSKNWSNEKLFKLIDNILDDSELFPILLIAPTKEERELSKAINEKFDNKLVIVESDFLALTSVLSGIDVLITPDTSVKHLADLLECKVVEYTTNFKTSLKQGTKGTGNIILEANDNDIELIKASVKFLLNPSEVTFGEILSDHIFITYKDELGWNLKPANGHFSDMLFRRQLKRKYIASWNDQNYNWDIKTYFSDYKYSKVQNLIDKEKSEISEVSRDLLGTLRSLVKASETPSEAKSFVISLEKLLSHCDSEFISSLPVIEFKSLLENLDRSNQSEQLRAAEELLYRLKKNLQVALDCLNTVEKDARAMPVNNRRRSEGAVERPNA